MQLTIFTPTYNRAYILKNLYDSLVNQTFKNFIWLIVDDGSTDNTKILVDGWIKKKEINIEYYKQHNQGKSMAHNLGTKLTKTELFTCVDSDDHLKSTAVEEIVKKWNHKENFEVIGILAYKGYSNNVSITTLKNKNLKISTLNDAYRLHGLKGDTMLIFKTDIISKYEFPLFSGERFVPEAFLYDLLDQEGPLLLLEKIIYYCEYLEDGYTANMAKLLVSNPQGYKIFLQQRIKLNKGLKEKALNTIRYIAICIANKEKYNIRNSVYPLLTALTYPFGYVFYLRRYRSV